MSKPSLAGKIVEMRAAGMTAAEVSAALGCTANYVYICSRGAPMPTAKERVQADLAAGKRCRVCWLLLPCADHQP